MQLRELEPANIISSRLQSSIEATIALAPNIVAALVVLLLGGLVSFGLRWFASRLLSFRKSREALRTAAHTLISVGVWGVTILVAATVALPGLTPAEAFAGIGIGSLAIGLAFRDIFENFLAGLLILVREPMRIGDYVECEDIAGDVERITIRDTYLRDNDGTLRLVPNAFLFKNPVRILTDQSERRQIAIVGVAYGSPLDRIPDLISDAIQTCDSAVQKRPIQVFAKEFSSSSVDFEVAWWSRSRPLDIRQSRDEVLRAIKRAFDANEISIPFPHRRLLIDDDIRLAARSLLVSDAP